MYKVILSQKSIFKIDNFIDSYRNSYLERFLDTGIFNEQLIINNYISISKEFRDNIYNEIQVKLRDDIVLGRMISENDNFSIFISIGNYKVLLNYEEDLESKIRFLRDIVFYK